MATVPLQMDQSVDGLLLLVKEGLELACAMVIQVVASLYENERSLDLLRIVSGQQRAEWSISVACLEKEYPDMSLKFGCKVCMLPNDI